MQVKELTDLELVEKCRELAGLSAIEKKVKDELRARAEDHQVDGVSLGAPSVRSGWKSSEEILSILDGSGISLEDLKTEVNVMGRLSVK